MASVDAQTCCDRIVHSIASICCQRLGVPARAVRTMFDTIVNMKFHLRTAFGDSKDHFGGDLTNPFQGVCQGNGGGPAVWLAVSLVLVDMSHAEGHTATIAQALTGIAFALCGLIFC